MTSSSDVSLSHLATLLHNAQLSGEACAKLSTLRPLTVADAYKIQALNIARRMDGGGLHGRPARLIGRKVGLTSTAIQTWLGVDQPDFGVLLDDMVVEDGGVGPIAQLLQPKAEGELAFIMKADLTGPGITAADVIAATDYIVPSIEVIDSRIANWDISYEDTIADNASSGMFALGTRPIYPANIDLRLCGMVLRKNGAVVSSGAGVASMGNPAVAIAWLANTLGEHGSGIRAGEVVLSGALGPVTPVAAGDFLEVAIGSAGRVSIRFE